MNDNVNRVNVAYNADCMDAMRNMPDNAFSLAVVDPPYGISVTGRHKVKDGRVPLVGGGETLRRRKK